MNCKGLPCQSLTALRFLGVRVCQQAGQEDADGSQRRGAALGSARRDHPAALYHGVHDTQLWKAANCRDTAVGQG